MPGSFPVVNSQGSESEILDIRGIERFFGVINDNPVARQSDCEK